MTHLVQARHVASLATIAAKIGFGTFFLTERRHVAWQTTLHTSPVHRAALLKASHTFFATFVLTVHSVATGIAVFVAPVAPSARRTAVTVSGLWVTQTILTAGTASEPAGGAERRSGTRLVTEVAQLAYWAEQTLPCHTVTV